MSKHKVAFVISHPIQYYVPLLQGLVRRGNVELKVFYTWGEDSITKFDPGFNRVVEWDIPLLEGYSHEFMENSAPDPGTHHFKGIDNPSLINKIEAYQPDKIVVFGWSFKSHLKVLRYFKGRVPIYFRGDSHLLTEQSFYKKIIRNIFLRWVYSHVDYAIAVGKNNHDYYRWVGLKENQILFAPHAVDEQRFLDLDGNQEKEADLFLASLKIPKEHVVFLYTGKFEYRKNLQTLILAKLKLKEMPCTLVLVGNGPDEEELRNLSKGDRNIHFEGFVNQSKMPIIYRSADVFVLPSISETWGLGINEAMNCGLAIIASDKVGSAIDLIQNNGFIFRAGDYIELSQQMIEIIENKNKLIQFKNQSKDIIKKWSIEQLVINFEKSFA